MATEVLKQNPLASMTHLFFSLPLIKKRVREKREGWVMVTSEICLRTHLWPLPPISLHLSLKNEKLGLSIFTS